MNIDIFDKLRSFVERAIGSLSTMYIWLDDAKLILETVDELRAELARRDEKIAELEAIVIPASFRKFLVEQIKDPELAEAYVKACIQDTTYKELLASRDKIITRLKEDGERLAVVNGYYCCNQHENYLCHLIDVDTHAPDCPITIHRALMKEIGG